MTKTEARPRIDVEASAPAEGDLATVSGNQPLRFFADIAADGMHQGKTTLALRLKAHLQEAGLPMIMVRIESQHVAARIREGEILIPIEDIGQSSATVGGIAGVMEPSLDAVSKMIENGGAVIFDWGGGLFAYRCELLAATGLDQELAQAGVPAWSFVVSTETEPSMKQALSVLERTADCAPRLQRALVLNSCTTVSAFCKPYHSLTMATFRWSTPRRSVFTSTPPTAKNKMSDPVAWVARAAA